MTRINPFQDVLRGISTKLFFFCQTMYPQIGTIKKPWEYSSEFNHADIRFFQTGKYAKTNKPTKIPVR
jgi:hypothetical protein